MLLGLTVLFIAVEVVIILFSLAIAVFGFDITGGNKALFVLMSIVILSIAVLMLSVSVRSLKRLRNKEKTMGRQIAYLYGLGLMWIISIIFFVSLDNKVMDGYFIFGCSSVFAIGLAVVLITFFNIRSKNRRELAAKQNAEKALEEYTKKSYFTYADDQWFFNNMLNDCGNAKDTKENADKGKVYDYAKLHMGYLLTWLADSGLLSESLCADKGDLVKAVVERKATGADLLKAMDYKIHSTDIGAGESESAFAYQHSKQRTYEQDENDKFIHTFLGHYYNSLYPFKKFFSEYEAFVSENEELNYKDFSWDIYKNFSKLMNTQYDYFVYGKKQKQIKLEYDNNETLSHDELRNRKRTITNDRFQLDFHIYAMPDVPQAYIERVIKSIAEMSEELQSEIASALLEEFIYGYDNLEPTCETLRLGAGDEPDTEVTLAEAIKEIKQNPKQLFYYDDLFGNLQLNIYAPRDDTVIAYVIDGSTWLDEEHGFSVSIFNNKVLAVGGAYNLENPWLANYKWID